VTYKGYFAEESIKLREENQQNALNMVPKFHEMHSSECRPPG
jgi:hypothetical protein